MMMSLFLPIVFQLAMWLLKRSFASDETKSRMLAVIKSAQDDGLIAKTNKDELAAQKQAIIDEINKEK